MQPLKSTRPPLLLNSSTTSLIPCTTAKRNISSWFFRLAAIPFPVFDRPASIYPVFYRKFQEIAVID